MNSFLTKLIAWIKANVLLSIIVGIVLVFTLSGTGLKRLFRSPRRRIHHRIPRMLTRRRRSLPRSVGMHKMKPEYNKNGTRKKPWQIKGSPAARRHMAQIRARR